MNQKLDPKAIRMWQVSRLIGLAVLLILGTLAAIWLIRAGAPMLLVWLTGLIVLIQLINLLVYPPIEYRQWSYQVTPDRIEIQKGIFFHQTRIIPTSRIQHVTVSEGPLARFYNLASVTIHTAGGQMKIDGLAKSVALEISENLKSSVNRKAQVQAEGDEAR